MIAAAGHASTSYAAKAKAARSQQQIQPQSSDDPVALLLSKWANYRYQLKVRYPVFSSVSDREFVWVMENETVNYLELPFVLRVTGNEQFDKLTPLLAAKHYGGSPIAATAQLSGPSDKVLETVYVIPDVAYLQQSKLPDEKKQAIYDAIDSQAIAKEITDQAGLDDGSPEDQFAEALIMAAFDEAMGGEEGDAGDPSQTQGMLLFIFPDLVGFENGDYTGRVLLRGEQIGNEVSFKVNAKLFPGPEPIKIDFFYAPSTLLFVMKDLRGNLLVEKTFPVLDPIVANKKIYSDVEGAHIQISFPNGTVWDIPNEGEPEVPVSYDDGMYTITATVSTEETENGKGILFTNVKITRPETSDVADIVSTLKSVDGDGNVIRAIVGDNDEETDLTGDLIWKITNSVQ
ncbi:MAG: hypothetical protein D6679_06775 [Candidatus Hydrogenedentota bacterium]|nr:MAG: hypothetical protein D6679_06775 [Candidatus Hydrogenedentota bacterium]